MAIQQQATASVDTGTDARIQEMMRTEFAEMTVLCIAHRLETIVDADKILVMEDGQVGEYGTPTELLAAKGLFHDLLSESDEGPGATQ